MTRLRDKLQLKNIQIVKIKTDLAPILQPLQQSLVEVEQKDPIKVRIINHLDFDYEVVDGRRRLQALIETGATHVMALVVNEMDDTELAIQALVGNSGTPNELDEARHIIKLMSDGYTGKQIAKMCGYSEATVSQRVRLVENLHPLLQDKLQVGEIKVSAALEATKMPQSEQEKLLSNGSKLSYKDVFEKVREWQGGQLDLFDVEPSNEVKPGLFLTSEQVEKLLEGEAQELTWDNRTFILSVGKIYFE